MDMVRDWYTVAEAMVYSRLRWLSYATDEADILYPSEKKIAEDLCMSERQVRRCILTLEDVWLIDVYRRGYRKRNNYYVNSLLKYPCKLE